MKKRGFKVNFPNYPLDKHPEVWHNGWEVTEEAIEINKQRIKERLEK